MTNEETKNNSDERIMKKIDEIERYDWDCANCGCVNEDTDKCKICEDYKENSVDNSKLEYLKKELNQEQKENG